ncbi:MAG: SsrA-binding protein SmpB [Rhodobiaceae bacterium]|jgi:SsrA-binding protein|nr:SsrA-binding protein SmpB [Rhodobiaceae bacterium]
MSSKSGGRKKNSVGDGTIAENRRARRDFEVTETFEAGLVLQGTEVKSLRQGKANLAHSFATVRDGEAFLMNADIPEYSGGNRFNHKPTQPRKVLMHRREINKLMAAVQRDGMTLVPLKLYFHENGRVKLLIGLARGRKKADRRDVEKRRDWDRQKARLLR